MSDNQVKAQGDALFADTMATTLRDNQRRHAQDKMKKAVEYVTNSLSTAYQVRSS